jgi:hypothetical protein
MNVVALKSVADAEGPLTLPDYFRAESSAISRLSNLAKKTVYPIQSAAPGGWVLKNHALSDGERFGYDPVQLATSVRDNVATPVIEEFFQNAMAVNFRNRQEIRKPTGLRTEIERKFRAYYNPLPQPATVEAVEIQCETVLWIEIQDRLLSLLDEMEENLVAIPAGMQLSKGEKRYAGAVINEVTSDLDCTLNWRKYKNIERAIAARATFEKAVKEGAFSQPYKCFNPPRLLHKPDF